MIFTSLEENYSNLNNRLNNVVILDLKNINNKIALLESAQKKRKDKLK